METASALLIWLCDCGCSLFAMLLVRKVSKSTEYHRIKASEAEKLINRDR
jgi:hypothetical protein